MEIQVNKPFHFKRPVNYCSADQQNYQYSSKYSDQLGRLSCLFNGPTFPQIIIPHCMARNEHMPKPSACNSHTFGIKLPFYHRNVSITVDINYHSNVNIEIGLLKGVRFQLTLITRHPPFSRVESVKKNETIMLIFKLILMHLFNDLKYLCPKEFPKFFGT